MRLKGITYLPRQDQANGRIREAEIYCSLSRTAWGKPTAKAQWNGSDRLQTVLFRQPVPTRYLKLLVKSTVNGRTIRGRCRARCDPGRPLKHCFATGHQPRAGGVKEPTSAGVDAGLQAGGNFYILKALVEQRCGEEARSFFLIS